jgi:hypothetical protein
MERIYLAIPRLVKWYLNGTMRRKTTMIEEEFSHPNPDTEFLGYKCPYFVCDLILTAHDYCQNTRRRVNGISGVPLKVSDEEFLDMFSFNWDQFLLKLHTRTMES